MDNDVNCVKPVHPLRSRLGQRIILILVLLSGTITLLTTLAQLYFDYNRQFNDVDKRHLEIRNVHSHALASSLWNFDLSVLKQKMGGLINLSHIGYLEIRSGDYQTSAGQPVENKKIEHIYPLTFKDPDTGKAEIVGTILVQSDIQKIYNTLIKDFLITLGLNTLKTTIVCYIILVIFHHSINKRIYSIVQYLREYHPQSRKNPLRVPHLPIITQDDDELSLLVWETNRLTGNLTTLYENIRFEKTRLADFAHVSTDWLWETDEHDRLIYCSNAMLEALKIKQSEQPILYEIPQFKSAALLRQHLENKQSFTRCEESLILDEQKQWLFFQAEAHYQDQRFSGFRGTTLNITELKNTQLELESLNQSLEQTIQDRTADLTQSLKQLKQAQSQLIQSEKLAALGGLVAGVAHEVNTPLGISVTATSVINEVILDFEQSFQNQTLTSTQFIELTDKLKSSASLLDHNLNRAAKLVKNFKQTAVDQVSENRCEFNVFQVLHALIASMHPETRKVPVSPNINGDEMLTMHSLPGSLTQIVSNLIMNSVSHAFDNTEISPRIDIEFYLEDKHVIFEYRDNGVGIEKNLHEKIFEPFFTTKRGQGGSGLGLNLVFNLVTQKMQGELEFSSQPGHGVLYRIKLPQKLDLKD
jgi:signal transduction histidine kinase